MKLSDFNRTMKHGKSPTETIKKTLWSTKKRKIGTCVLSAIVVFGMLGGLVACSTGGNGSESGNVTGNKKTEKVLTGKHSEKDLTGIISGIADKYIVQNAEGIDYLHNVQVNDDIVEHVDVDSDKVDLNQPGEYDITYTVTLNAKKLAEHLDEKTDASKTAEEEIVLDKTVTVVTQEDAQKLADQGKIVIGSNNETVPKSDGTVTPTPEPEGGIDNATQATPTPEAEKPSGSGSATKPSNSGGSSSGSTGNKNNGSSGSSNSGNSSSGSGGSSGGSGSSSSGGNGNTHTHNWEAVTKTVHHDATGHYETKVITPAYDEPVYEYRSICNGCGADITDNIEHIFECPPGSYSNKKIQTGTIHHEAVTEQVWVQDTPAYDEIIVTGYKCSCGATK